MHEMAFKLTVCHVTVCRVNTCWNVDLDTQAAGLTDVKREKHHVPQYIQGIKTNGNKSKEPEIKIWGYVERGNGRSGPLLHTAQDANFCHDPFQGK